MVVPATLGRESASSVLATAAPATVSPAAAFGTTFVVAAGRVLGMSVAALVMAWAAGAATVGRLPPFKSCWTAPVVFVTVVMPAERAPLTLPAIELSTTVPAVPATV